MASRKGRKAASEPAEVVEAESVMPRRSTRRQQQQHEAPDHRGEGLTAAAATSVATASSSMPPPASKGKERQGESSETAAPSRSFAIPRRGTVRHDRQESIPSITSGHLDDDGQTASTGTRAAAQEEPRATLSDDAPAAGQAALDEATHKAAASLMKQLLPRLLSAAGDLRDHYAGSVTEIWEIQLDALRRAFEAYRATYLHADGALYIQLGHVLTALSSGENLASAALVSRIVVLANLATLLDDVTSAESGPESERSELVLRALQSLDDVFPIAFLPVLADGQRVVDSEIYDLALELRTQKLIQTLRNRHDTSRSVLEYVDAIFVENDESVPSLPELKNLRKGQKASLTPRPFPELDLDGPERREFHSAYRKRLKRVCTILDPEDEVKSVDHLDHDFPLGAFWEALLAWAERTFDMVSEGEGEGDNITVALARYQDPTRPLTRQAIAEEASQHGEDDAAELPPSRPARAAHDKSPILGETNRRARWAEQSNAPPSAQPSIPNWDIVDHARDIDAGSDSSASLPELAEVSRAHDRQPGRSGHGHHEKRARGPDDGGDEEEDFETDDRVQHLSASQTDTVPPPKKSRVHPQSTASGTTGTQQQSNVDVEALSQRARQEMQFNRVHRSRQPQKRVPWRQEDVNLLLRAIEEFGAAWAEIERQIKTGTIPMADLRDQQALRDKARQFKQHLLITDMALPANFDMVMLSRKEAVKVMACGKNPARKEGDVDDDLNPTNTQYVGPVVNEA